MSNILEPIGAGSMSNLQYGRLGKTWNCVSQSDLI